MFSQDTFWNSTHLTGDTVDELISSVLQIELANVALDAEMNQLNKKEAELADV